MNFVARLICSILVEYIWRNRVVASLREEESPDSKTNGALRKQGVFASGKNPVRATVTNRVASGETTKRWVS